MATYHITSPDGSEYEVTGEGSEQDALQHLQSQLSPAQPPQAQQPPAAAAPAEQPQMPFAERMKALISGLNVAFPIATPVGEAAAQMTTGAVAGPAAGLAGLASLPAGADTAADNTNAVASALQYQPSTPGGQMLSRAVNSPFELLGKGADTAGEYVSQKTGSPLAGALTNTAIQAAPSILLKGRGKAAEVGGDVTRTADLGPRAPARPGAPEVPAPTSAERPAGLAGVPEKAPSKEQLKADAGAAYDRAEKAGGVISPESFDTAKQTITGMLEKEGIDPTLHPSTTAALKRINDTTGPVSFQKLETLRRIAKDAEGAQAPADKRLAAKIVETIDDYANTLGQKDLTAGTTEAVGALKEARGLWSRARKADTLDELSERAENKAGANFTQSGMENALRQEFKALANNSKKMRVFTTEERAAIRKVARGGLVQNGLRNLGKFDPSSGGMSALISSVIGYGGALPTGGLSLALPVAGFAAKRGATRMTMNNVARANELVRRGPPPKNALAKRSRNALADIPTE